MMSKLYRNSNPLTLIILCHNSNPPPLSYFVIIRNLPLSYDKVLTCSLSDTCLAVIIKCSKCCTCSVCVPIQGNHAQRETRINFGYIFSGDRREARQPTMCTYSCYQRKTRISKISEWWTILTFQRILHTEFAHRIALSFGLTRNVEIYVVTVSGETVSPRKIPMKYKSSCLKNQAVVQHFINHLKLVTQNNLCAQSTCAAWKSVRIC